MNLSTFVSLIDLVSNNCKFCNRSEFGKKRKQQFFVHILRNLGSNTQVQKIEDKNLFCQKTLTKQQNWKSFTCLTHKKFDKICVIINEAIAPLSGTVAWSR